MTETVPKFTLKALRVNKKKTQQEIADYLEVNLRTYQKYEKDPDTMSWGNAKKLAKHYYLANFSIPNLHFYYFHLYPNQCNLLFVALS